MDKNLRNFDPYPPDVDFFTKYVDSSFKSYCSMSNPLICPRCLYTQTEPNFIIHSHFSQRIYELLFCKKMQKRARMAIEN